MPGRGKSNTKGRSRTPLAVAQQRVGLCRPSHRWSNAPEQFARIRRREENSGVNVAQPERALYPGSGRGLVDDGHNGPCDKIPVLIQSDRNDRLNIHDPLRGVVGADPEIKVVLEGDADEVGDWVLGFLGQFLSFAVLVADRFGGVCAEKLKVSNTATKKDRTWVIQAAFIGVLFTGFLSEWVGPHW